MRGNRIEFIQLVFPASTDFGMDERDEVEEALNLALSSKGIGEVSGSGAGFGVMNLDVNIEEERQEQIAEVQQALREVLAAFHPPIGSTMRFYPLSEEKITIQGGLP